jgi:NAD(P)-dependent dehydrogenase (short-subunit alcohol dehydrogenase family)
MPFQNSTAEEVAEHFKDQIRGQNILVTGASLNGLGAAFLKAIAPYSPGLLVLAGRSHKALAESEAELLKETPGLKTRLLIVDFASLDSVRKAAAEVLAYDEKITISVMNAGVMMTPEGKTADGIETQFGVNHVGPFLFTNLLLEGATKPAPPRSVIVSSMAQIYMADGINFDQPGYFNDQKDTYGKIESYAQSKAANVLFAAALHRRGWEAVSLHPGVIATGLVRHMTDQDYRDAGQSTVT